MKDVTHQLQRLSWVIFDQAKSQVHRQITYFRQNKQDVMQNKQLLEALLTNGEGSQRG